MRILFISELASIHSARWVNQFKDMGWDLHVYQGYARGNGICPEYRCGRLYIPEMQPVPNNLPYSVTLSKLSKVEKIARLLFGRPVLQSTLDSLLARDLANLIRKIKPDIIHSLGLNINWTNMMLSVKRAHDLLGKFDAPWIYSSWGADLTHYASLRPDHQAEVEYVLGDSDYHISECERDVRLCRDLGFRGELAGILPAFGGTTWDAKTICQPGLPSERKTILLKGRDILGGDPQGRALTAMKAFGLCKDILKGYRIVIVHAAPVVAEEATYLSSTTDLDIHVIPNMSFTTWLRIFGATRLFICSTVTDGLPSTLVEGMSLGAFPIHSGLDSIREWIDDGKNGLLIPPEDPEAIAAAIRIAISDDSLINSAAEINARIVREKLSGDVVKAKVIKIYAQVKNQGKVIPD